MKPRILVGALVAAGVIGAGTAAWRGELDLPAGLAHANPAMVGGVAAPAANPAATTLPLNGFSDLVKKYGPAVVNVSVEGTRNVASRMEAPGMPDLEDHPGLRDFFGGFRGRIPHGEMPTRGQGSGFIVSNDGYILTNAHVVENADRVNVKLTDRREYKAKVVGVDKATDIAVLKIDAKELPTVVPGKSADANVGEWVVAIGSPFGFENSVTAGIVSAKGRSLPDANYVPFLQTDVAVNPGNSGGPLFNLAGQVIGINSQIYSRSGGFQGISFAIPIEVAMQVKDEIVKHGKVSRARIGAAVQEVNATLAESFRLDRPRGALVSSVEPGSPAEKAGLKPGDIILSFDGKPVERSAELPVLVGAMPAGAKASVEIWRDGASRTVSVSPVEGASKVASRERSPAATGGRLGVAVRELSPEERRAAETQGGVVVEQVSGPAARAGLQRGDIVLSLNGTPVKDAEALRDMVGKAGRSVALLVQREQRQIFVPVELG